MTEQLKKQPELTNLFNHKVLHDFILVLPIEFEGGSPVESAATYEDKPEWGVVVQSGPGIYTDTGDIIETGLEQGDVILFMPYGATKIRSLGQDFVYIRAEDVISVNKET